MSRYNFIVNGNSIGVNMAHASHVYAGSSTGDIIAYDPWRFEDIYSYGASGRDGSTSATAYLVDEGPTFVTKTANECCPVTIPYFVENGVKRPMIADLFDKISGLSACGYPVSIVGVMHEPANDRISIGRGLISGKQEIDFYGQSSYRVYMTVARHANGPTMYLQPNGQFSLSSHEFEFIAFDFCSALQVSFSSDDIYYDGVPCRFEIALRTKIANVDSVVTRCSINFLEIQNGELVAKISQNAQDGRSMYHDRYFCVSYGIAHLPALGKYTSI